MSDYSMTHLSAKQSLIDIQIKRMKKLNCLLAEMVVNEMDIDILNAIQDICQEIKSCASDINKASESIGSYAFMARQELKRAANAAALAEGKLPVINNVDNIDPYVATVGEAEQNG